MGIGSKHEVGWLAGWSVDDSDGDGVWDGTVKKEDTDEERRQLSPTQPFSYITN